MTTEISAAEYRRLMDQPEAGSLPDTMDMSGERGVNMPPPGPSNTVVRTPSPFIASEKRKQKYGAVKTEVDGITFASKAEASRYVDLMRLQEAGEIEIVELQPKFPLIVQDFKVGVYIGDFMYREHGELVVEDVKGMKTPVYRIKKKLMKAIYGIDIRETS